MNFNGNFFFVYAQETPESLLRSALQGKGYSKGMQNAVTAIPSINSIKSDGNLRRAIFTDSPQVNYLVNGQCEFYGDL